MVLLDRSWYNRAGVERVMGFCTDDEYWEFLRTTPEFERMLDPLAASHLVKYWFSVSDEEQERRFQDRINDPDQAVEDQPDGPGVARPVVRVLEGQGHDVPLHRHQASPRGGWSTLSEKRRARLNCIAHLLGHPLRGRRAAASSTLPPQPGTRRDYVRPPKESMRWVPSRY